MRSRALPSPPSRTTVALLAALFTLVLTSVGTVWATHSTALIGACAHDATGALRLVDDPDDCKNAETPVHWNAEGPHGPQGEPGPQGPAGSGAATGQACPAGEVVTGIDTGGGLVCTALDDVAGSVDADSDGWTFAAGDCDDSDPLIHPGATDIPDDGIDQDCDGGDLHTYFIDADGDGYGNHQGTTAVLTEPTPPAGYSLSSDDCDDSDPSIHPGATDTLGDGIDQDCDGVDG